MDSAAAFVPPAKVINKPYASGSMAVEPMLGLPRFKLVLAREDNMMRIAIAAFVAGAAWVVMPAQAQDTTSQPSMAPAESATPPMQAAPPQEAAPVPAQVPPAPDVTPAPATAAPQIITQPTQAQSEAPKAPAAAPAGRYRFNRVANGFLRLDNETGQIAYCSTQTAAWGCETVPENRAALEIEIGQLRKEVDDLKKQIAALQAAPPAPTAPPAEAPPRPPETVPPAAGGDVKLNLPTQEDIDRAAAFISDTWRRLVEMIVNLQKDAMRRS